MAATAISILPWPEMITTGTCGKSVFTFLRMSIPSISLSFSQMSKINKPGGCDVTCRIASSEVPAMRVLYPSSIKISEINSRMSRSSSTIKISPFRTVSCRRNLGYCIGWPCRQIHNHTGPLTRRVPKWFRIVQSERSSVFFDNFLNNRQPQSCALITGGDIGFEQTASIMRQADAIVCNLDLDCLILPLHAHRNYAANLGQDFALDAGLDRLACVFYQIGQGLVNHRRIDHGGKWSVLDCYIKMYVGLACVLQCNRLGQ